MKTSTPQKYLIVTLFLLSIFSHSSLSYLSTNSRWIVNPYGDRYKLRCVNWAGHVHVMIPEGLEKQPLKGIAEVVPATGFNCVRLTWATQMYTKFANLTVEQSLLSSNLTEAWSGIKTHNPDLLGMSIVDVQEGVINELQKNGVVVVLDNHVSTPIWCCDKTDGNGFFGDQFFDPEEWLQGLSIAANKYKDNPTVVGMSLRNELRGARQNETIWYNYMQQGAETINKQNPNILVIVSGFTYATDLRFLKQRPFNVSFKNKLVFEAHWYSFGNNEDKWKHQTNEVCGQVINTFSGQSGFLLRDFPLFLSEFGVDQRLENEMEDSYLSCLLAHAASLDLDWALWAFQGSYMFRQNVKNMEEFYGIVTKDWKSTRSFTVLQRLLLNQQVLHDPTNNDPGYEIIFHPYTGNCIHVDGDNVINNDHCDKRDRWNYDPSGKIQLNDGKKCLTATGDQLPVTLSNDCTSNQSTWKMISGSNLHLATTDNFGKLLCLDWDIPNSFAIVTRKCMCLDDAGKDVTRCEENPKRQWFKLVPSNIS